MPTGYTAKLLESGEPFAEYAMRCARAFGALVMMRDEPMEAPIPKFEPSDYYTKRRTEAQAELDRLAAMTEAERITFGEAEKEKVIRMYEGWLEKQSAENRRLMAVRAEAEAWTPPTKDHEGLKQFMIEQIDTSLNDTGYVLRSIQTSREKEPMFYYGEAVRNALSTREGCAEKDVEERQCTDERNRWVEDLRTSLIK